jgi:transcriptional regulator of acetoin/glycerol metabolism
MDALMAYAWPGNVRELRTAMEHAVVLCRTDAVALRDLPQNVRSGRDEDFSDDGGLISGDMTVKEAEKQLIVRALKETNGNRSAAAKKIGISRRTLHRKLHTYQLENL